MHFHLIFALALLGFVLWFGLVFFMDYRAATGTTWQRLLAAARQSATVLWSKFVMLVSLLIAGLDQIADWLGQPELADKIQAVLNPKLVPFYLIGIAVITIWARKRTLAKS